MNNQMTPEQELQGAVEQMHECILGAEYEGTLVPKTELQLILTALADCQKERDQVNERLAKVEKHSYYDSGVGSYLTLSFSFTSKKTFLEAIDNLK